MTETTCALRVGQPVPNLEIDVYKPTDKGFGKIKLADLKAQDRWTILFFYPADFTFVCATEFAALANRYEEFRGAGAEVITMSTDTVYTHLAWQQNEKELSHVQYPMGADRTGAIARMFGVLDEASGNALRGTFIISPQGTLVNAEVNFFNLGRNVEELMRKLKANIYMSRVPGEVCPAQWTKEGDATLKPGADLVGKVHEALQKKR